MVCFHPIKAWKATKADLTIAPNLYYKNKKIKFTKDDTREEITIPCGHCLGCKLDKSSEWATRVYCESKLHKENCFITLTYNTPNLPINENGLSTLKKKNITDFIKRLRYYLYEQKIEIKYFGCGEYGNTGGRPHAHIAILGWQPKDLEKYKPNKHGQMAFKSKFIQNLWGKGFCVIEDLTYESACYIARYVQKKAGVRASKTIYTGEIEEQERIDERNGKKFIYTINKRAKKKTLVEPEYLIMSQGIAKKYWEQNKEKIKRNNGILIKLKDKTIIKPIPRYFKKIWEAENWEECYRHKLKIQKNFENTKKDILNKISLNGECKELTNEQKWKYYIKTQQHTLECKSTKLKRNEFI